MLRHLEQDISALIILLIHWCSGAKRDTLYSLSMTSLQHTALKCLRNLRLTQNEYVKKFPVIVFIHHLRNNTCYYSAGKHKPFTPQFPALSPFGVPMATHPHPGGSGAWTVRQSTQRQGSLKSNFTSKVQLHYENINDLKERLRLWLVEKVWMMLIVVITSACSVLSQ